MAAMGVLSVLFGIVPMGIYAAVLTVFDRYEKEPPLLMLGVFHAFVTPIGKWTCPECHSWIALSYSETLSNDVWLAKTQLLAVLGLAALTPAGRHGGPWPRARFRGRRSMREPAPPASVDPDAEPYE